MCELFGAYGWKLGIRDMKWIVDHLLARRINRFVPHRFSIAEYPDLDSPHHFYARGNNPQYKYFKSLMKYVNRMSHLLNNGRHLENIGILYHAESEWMGEYMDMSEPARRLIEKQIDFNFIYSEMLVKQEVWNAYEKDGQYIINGKYAGERLCPPYIVELQPQSIELLTPGKREIVIEVATTLHREQIDLYQAPFQYVYEPYEPTGILGKVKLLYM